MDSSLKKSLKAQAHHLKPVVLLGAKGLTPAVLEEVNIALTAHELIKISIKGMDKKEKTNSAELICKELSAAVVQIIGNIAVIYRKKPE